MLESRAQRSGERMPVYLHVINHPDVRLLVDTGMTELHPAVADLDPRLHFDHCGDNHLFACRPICVQRRELDEPWRPRTG